MYCELGIPATMLAWWGGEGGGEGGGGDAEHVKWTGGLKVMSVLVQTAHSHSSAPPL